MSDHPARPVPGRRSSASPGPARARSPGGTSCRPRCCPVRHVPGDARRRRERPVRHRGGVRDAALRRREAAAGRPAHRRRRHQRPAARARGPGRAGARRTTCCRSRSCWTPRRSVCWERTRARPDRDFGRHVVRRQHRDLRRSLRALQREGFRQGARAGRRGRPPSRSCYERLLQRPARSHRPVRHHRRRARLPHRTGRRCWPGSGWTVRPDGAEHPDGRTAVFVGDLVDRGPDSPGVLRLVMGMVAAGTALCVAGNHEEKLLRKLRGRNVRVSHGLAETLAQLDAGTDGPGRRRRAVPVVADQPLRARRRPAGRRARRAARRSTRAGRPGGCGRSACTATPPARPTSTACRCATRGRRTTAARAVVVYGHTPVVRAEWINNTICLDTGCVFGGALTALRYPERQTVSVPAGARVLRSRPSARPGRTRDGAGRADAGRPDRAPRAGHRLRPGDGRGGERRRRAGGDEPVRDRPAVAALVAADDGAVVDLRGRRLPRASRAARWPTTPRPA